MGLKKMSIGREVFKGNEEKKNVLVMKSESVLRV